MSDRLEALLANYPFDVSTLHAGPVGHIHSLHHPDGFGQLHLLTEGAVEVRSGGSPAFQLREPTVLHFARPAARTFITEPGESATLVSADIEFHGGRANPILSALPDCITLPLAMVPDAAPIFAMLNFEGAGDHCGRKVVMDSLCRVVMIQFLRELMEQRKIEGGMLAGLGHPLLMKAIVALHNRPETDWSVEMMAETAGMSRTSFAETFKETVGVTPGAYLQAWRIGLAQNGIRAGRALKLVAMDVGYGSEGALSRAFRSQTGHSPTEWKRAVTSRQAA